MFIMNVCACVHVCLCVCEIQYLSLETPRPRVGSRVVNLGCQTVNQNDYHHNGLNRPLVPYILAVPSSIVKGKREVLLCTVCWQSCKTPGGPLTPSMQPLRGRGGWVYSDYSQIYCGSLWWSN